MSIHLTNIVRYLDKCLFLIYIIDNRYIDIRYSCEGENVAREQLKNLTEPMYYVLLSLITPQYGYGIMQKVEQISGGRVKVGAGTLYALLSRFQREDIIKQVGDDGRRKTYCLTERGVEILKDEYGRIKHLVCDGMPYLEKGGAIDEKKI